MLLAFDFKFGSGLLLLFVIYYNLYMLTSCGALYLSVAQPGTSAVVGVDSTEY
jgi:hypothetical protein